MITAILIVMLIGMLMGWQLHRFWLAHLYRHMHWIRKQMRGGARR